MRSAHQFTPANPTGDVTVRRFAHPFVARPAYARFKELHFLLLNVESLMIDRGERRIIRDLSFQVRSSEALLLRGRNGAGKTTLIRAIAGFLAPTSGKLTLEGGHEEMTLAEQCHYIGHLNGVKANMTVSENLGFWGRYLEPDADRAAQQDRLETALETFDLLALEDIPAGYLSAGQKRRVGLARLKLADRPLWLLDEPTVSLDTASVAILAEAVKSHVASGGLAIAATHIPLGLETARTLELVPNLNLDSTGAEADAEAW